VDVGEMVGGCGLMWLRIEKLVAGFCEHGNELLCFLKGKEVVEYLIRFLFGGVS
jgi:hypothetical protein